MSERSSPSPAHLTNTLFYFKCITCCLLYYFHLLLLVYLLYFILQLLLFSLYYFELFLIVCSNAALLWQYECTNICHANKAPKL